MTLKEKIEKIGGVFPDRGFTPGAALKEDGAIEISLVSDYMLGIQSSAHIDERMNARLFLGSLQLPTFGEVGVLTKLHICAEILGADFYEIDRANYGEHIIHFHYLPTKLEIQEARIAKAKSQLSDLEKELAELKTIEKCNSAPTV